MKAWLRKYPAAAFVPFLMVMYFWNLKTLSPWGDEAYAFQTMRLPVPEILRLLAHDVHPPLYYLLLYGWLRVPLGLDWEVQARALSGILALASFLAADRLWASRLPERGRIGFLALWAASPCLLLYARICHSFCLQLLVGTVVAAAILRFDGQRPTAAMAGGPEDTPAPQRESWRKGGWLAAGLIVGLYTHYVVGLALLVTANLVLLRRKRWSEALRLDAVVGVAYLPWAWWLVRALGEWSSHPLSYSLTGSALLETPLKLAYWAISFVMGEAQPDAVLVAGMGVMVLAGLLVLSGMRRNRPVAWLIVPLAAIGFIGVARWVSYPFIPARMLYVFPLFLVMLMEGAVAHRRLGMVAVPAMLALSLAGIWSYSQGTGFRNKQYVMPLREIAAEIKAQSSAGNSLVLVDTPNSDIVALAYCLGEGRRVLGTGDPGTAEAVTAALADPKVKTVWFLRNPHDVTPQGLDERYQGQLRAAMAAEAQNYQRFSPLETCAMQRMGMKNPPSYFQELWRFGR